MVSRHCQTAGAGVIVLLLLCCGLVSSSFNLIPLKPCVHCHHHGEPSQPTTPASPLNQSPYIDCTTNFTQLERALLETDNNRYKIIKAFYPPRGRPSVYVDIEYRFGDDDNQTEKWIWTAAPFYYIQPPSMFVFTSLCFSNPTEEMESVSLHFPAECRVPNESIIETEHSRCGVNPMLDVLTQRLQLYARYNDLFDVVVVETLANAVCALDLEDKYIKRNIIIIFYASMVVFPFIVVILIVVLVKSLRTQIRLKLMNRRNHANLAAIALTGVIFSLYVLGMDIAALVYGFAGKHELHKYSIQVTYSNTVILLTTVIDFIPISVSLGAFFLLYCCEAESKKCFMNYCFKIFFSCIFPDQNDTFPTDEEKELWILSLLLTAPLVCLSTHASYIIIAWISDPQHASSATFIALLSFFYYFISFRQLYNALSKSRSNYQQPVQQPVQRVQLEPRPLQLVQPGQPGQRPEQQPAQPAQPVQQPVQEPGQRVQLEPRPLQLVQPGQPGQRPEQQPAQPAQPVQQPVQEPGQRVQLEPRPLQLVQPGQRPEQQPARPGQRPEQQPAQPVQPTQELARLDSAQQLVQPAQAPTRQLQQVPVQQRGQPAQRSASRSPYEEYIQEHKWHGAEAKFNIGVCMFELFFGVIVLVGMEAFLIVAIGRLPFNSTAASMYIFQLLQLGLVALAMLITYQVLVTDDSLQHQLMRSIIKAYNGDEVQPQAAEPQPAVNNEPQDRSDTEIVGRLIGKLIYKYNK